MAYVRSTRLQRPSGAGVAEDPDVLLPLCPGKEPWPRSPARSQFFAALVISCCNHQCRTLFSQRCSLSCSRCRLATISRTWNDPIDGLATLCISWRAASRKSIVADLNPTRRVPKVSLIGREGMSGIAVNARAAINRQCHLHPESAGEGQRITASETAQGDECEPNLCSSLFTQIDPKCSWCRPLTPPSLTLALILTSVWRGGF